MKDWNYTGFDIIPTKILLVVIIAIGFLIPVAIYSSGVYINEELEFEISSTDTILLDGKYVMSDEYLVEDDVIDDYYYYPMNDVAENNGFINCCNTDKYGLNSMPWTVQMSAKNLVGKSADDFIKQYPDCPYPKEFIDFFNGGKITNCLTELDFENGKYYQKRQGTLPVQTQ